MAKKNRKAQGGGNNHSDPEQGLTPEERAYRDAVIPPLLMRAYHLPGNNWTQDWVQYMTNNHPFFGICFHHKLHPVSRSVRIFALIGSCLFGLALTNIIYLAFVFSDADHDKAYVEVPKNTTLTGQAYLDSVVDTGIDALTVNNGNIALWTIGAFLHGTYDHVVWSLAACSCCMKEGDRAVPEKRMQRFRSTGTLLVIFSVVVVTALATFAVALRSALDSGNVNAQEVENYGLKDENVDIWQVNGANDLEFLLAYLVELALSFFIFYPICGTILFSGILTCGRGPTIGGRPYEMKEAAAARGEGVEVIYYYDDNKAVTQEQPRKSKKNKKSKKNSKK